ncbi:MAG TPA: methylenetetrahydrofolate--tRNA-(uracil(54)-C(5))-methyltransferase (FADH(2)-oxidizing) TrmFO [Candidatus Pullichristensenella excrementigallinarum]|uniref:Methylenetetrahydrofolate--tRNA-(uracil-5-)-methyltransferase TrmFO n=1 Tax=Candidatus Pullichristensenella excrementigallinarum TaxID=2840907 RepID=A0A9D1IBD5_9FIRM|nr:methylenetetrahydrofolate--tRNA-(uracil(54)-C(5))-methyltransferase (FADH(2)-oxidizing) TrmFO [Candidatus Pullichristensenella excrementigallinarum]
MTNRVTVVGAGLAGSEAAWQLASRGIPVLLLDMKPGKTSPAHTHAGFAELVCSNSLKAMELTNASGLLKEEMRRLNSLVLRAAEATRVPAGGALAVDREAFSEYVTRSLKEHALVQFEERLVSEIPEAPAILATGPLTDPALTQALTDLPGMKALHFFDAAAPIVTAESIDMEKVFRASRYDRGADYLNCPMSEEEYNSFYDALISAELAPVHAFEKKLVFEGCLAVEILAARGRQTLAFGPLKPVGLIDPRTGKEPWAVVQLRQENAQGTLYNLVGFQTRLKWGEQKRVFSMIPGLENAEFARYGVMHRNTYLNSPDVLGKNFAWKDNPLIRFAGQLTGVEGYMESAASGIVAAIGLARALRGLEEPDFTAQTVLGALERHVRTRCADFQPMNANFGILDKLDARVKGKRNRYLKLSERALETLEQVIDRYELRD